MATKDEELSNDILKEAIAGTENEIFSEAVGANPDHSDDTGDRSVEEMGTGLEGQHEGDEDGTEVEASAEGDDADGKTEGAEEADGEDGKEGEQDSKRDPKTGQFKAKKDGDESEGAEGDEADRSQEQQTQANKRVPLSEVITERRARQAAEQRATELETRHQTEIQALNQRLDSLLVAVSKGQPIKDGQAHGDPQETTDQSLDELLISNPTEFARRLREDTKRELRNEFVQADMERAADTHKEAFQTAFKALTDPAQKTDPVRRATVQRIYASASPGEAIMRWHKEEQTRAAMAGKSPEDIIREHEEKLAGDAEYRKTYRKQPQQQAEQRDETGTRTQTEQPRHVTKLPKSLNGAGGRSAGGNPSFNSGASDKDIFNDVMSGG